MPPIAGAQRVRIILHEFEDEQWSEKVGLKTMEFIVIILFLGFIAQKLQDIYHRSHCDGGDGCDDEGE